MSPIERAVEAAKAALINDPETTAYMDARGDPDLFMIDGEIRLSPVVRAVLQAIREPSEGMVRADMGAALSLLGGGSRADVWRAMIDAALSE